ncbi:hypothetical protein HUU05_10580 [candidate division KSB1 bacterium]|nr:hypothetical protein [candidate division KSB1 bacterium]
MRVVYLAPVNHSVALFTEHTMRSANPICPERIRNIRACTFGWIDHNFLHRGFFARLSHEELLLYFFLVTVADKNGVSFYDYARIGLMLQLPAEDYVSARKRLCERGLIAYRDGIFQVLTLPAVAHASPASAPPRGANEFQTLKEILQHVKQ